jgi:hydroxypyruvate reductase
MIAAAHDLRADAERIWRAGVAAVMPDRLIESQVHVDGDWLVIGGETVDLRIVGRIAIVGAGKAAAAMTVALENALGTRVLAGKGATGWVNVPADCIIPTQRVHLHAARPAGVNEPRPEGVRGTQEIRKIVSSLGPADLCLCVLSGGGSALLTAPIERISLDDKIQLTRLLSAAGANIEQLNTVRQQFSLVKGGRLLGDCTAGRLITLAISDVPGDAADVIASGPTVPTSITAADALTTLQVLGLKEEPSLKPLICYLNAQMEAPWSRPGSRSAGSQCEASYVLLGNNAVAVDAAGVEAERLGYSHAMISATAPEGAAEEVGRHVAATALAMRESAGLDCLISGGEPTVRLVAKAQRGEGGRNQQLALAALMDLGDCRNTALLSAGTDGEDGPTDAAGAIVTADVVDNARRLQLDPGSFLARNDAYHFFQQTGGLFITGPTHTNVCDLRVVIVNRNNAPATRWGRG